MGDDLLSELADARMMMQEALIEFDEAGIALAHAEKDYQRAKNVTALNLKAAGYTATMIDKILKGDERVAVPLFARDCAQARYDTAKERINVCKLDARLIEAQIEREWQQEKRM